MEVFHTFSEINNKYRERKMEQVFSERVKGYRLPLEFRYGYVPAIVYGSRVINDSNNFWESNKKLIKRNEKDLLDILALHEFKLEYIYQKSIKDLNENLNEEAKKDILLYKISGDLEEELPATMLSKYFDILISKLLLPPPFQNNYRFSMRTGTFIFNFHTFQPRFLQSYEFDIWIEETSTKSTFAIKNLTHLDVGTWNKIINSFYNQKDQITELFKTSNEMITTIEKIAKEGI